MDLEEDTKNECLRRLRALLSEYRHQSRENELNGLQHTAAVKAGRLESIIVALEQL